MANRIIVVSGPGEGVGKTTLAVNFAARLAHAQKQPVIVIDMDMLCRGEAALLAGADNSMSVFQVLDQLASKQLTLPMLRGRVPLTRHNIGTLMLAPLGRPADQITADQWAYFLQAFSQVYDVVIDIEISHPFKVLSFELADAIIWTFTPHTLPVRSTVQQLDLLHQQKFGFGKFVFALNQAGAPHALAPEIITDALSRFEKDVAVQVPFDDDLVKLVNVNKPSIIEPGRNEYWTKLGLLVEQATKLRREGSQAPQGSNGALSSRSANGAIAKLQHTVVDTLLQEKRKKWDELKQRLHRGLVEELNIRRIDLDTKGDPIREKQLRTNVESTVNALLTKERDLALGRDEREQLVKELVDEALGLGPLEELLADPKITEIMVNRFDQVFVERHGKITLSDKRFIDNNHVVQVVRRIISPLGRRIDESVPMVDARLKDGSRVNAIIPPLAVQGPTLTIRRFPEKAFGPADLIRMDAINAAMIEFLRVCVLLKKNMVISGGTGTGKTTILNMLSGFIPNDDRIITVEDTAELRMQQQHVVRLEARPPNIEGQGQVSIRDLVKNCLRMRPDRIVVGECRGGEALDMLQAMNTGHEGSLTTVHANTPRDAFTRLETLCLMAGMDLPVWAIREQIRSAVHLVVQLTRLQDGSRKVTCITEVTGRDEETILTQDLFRYVQDGVDASGVLSGHYEATGQLPSFVNDLKAKGLTLDLSAFSK